MKTLKFANEEAIDLDAVTTMGVSVKTGDNPIGYFGTGLKYAIATLLRTGHKFRLIRCGKPYSFTARKHEIRGGEFQVVYMNKTKLGFTTDLGKNWTPMEAYRELASNCMDEGGNIGYQVVGKCNDTIIEVEGDGINKARELHNTIFLSTHPLLTGARANVHDGETDKLYYRGLLAMTSNKVFKYTYNLTGVMTLTEDRTLKYPWVASDELASLIMNSSDYTFILSCLLADPKYHESTVCYSGTPGETFMRVVGDHIANIHLNLTAVELWKKGKDTGDLYRASKLDKFDLVTIAEALELLAIVGVEMEIGDFMISAELTGAHGLVRDGDIIIARTTLDRGARFLASTLFEEWTHKVKSFYDYTREFQDFTIDTMFGLADKLKKCLD